MSQTIAIFVDAYRELHAKRLFWITMILTGLLSLAFALMGVTPSGLSFAGMSIPTKDPDYWYKWVFSGLVGLWIAWGAIVLALISTAGIFPDFMVGGSIDLYFSKPIGRLRLFLTKWATGLFFVLLQGLVFALGSFLVYGFRGGKWMPSIFLIVPLVVCLFSYLYAVAVFFGVLTRSTIAAILLTVLVWTVVAAGNWVERKMFETWVQSSFLATTTQDQVRLMDERIKSLEAEKASASRSTAAPDTENARIAATQPASVTVSESTTEPVIPNPKLATLRTTRDMLAREARQNAEMAEKLGTWRQTAFLIVSVLPKTTETIALFDRSLFDDSDLISRNEQERGLFRNIASGGDEEEFQRQIAIAQDAKLAAERAERNRSVTWVIGTSLLFEAVVLGIAAWIFCRRDY